MAHAADEAAHRARALYDRGLKQYNLGDFREALDSFKGAYLEKADPAFLFNIGQCHRRLGEPDKAAETYRTYLRLHPGAPNRSDVEEFIREADKEIAARRAPPQGTIAPAENPAPAAPVTAPPPVVEPTPPPAIGAPPTPVYRKWWFWTAIGGVVLVGAGVATAIAVSTPNDATIPMTAGGNVVFP